MHQVGVYGRLNDDAETLLFIMQDARGVEVPSTKVNGDFEIELSALLAVSNKANISITVDPQMQALAKMVKAEVEKQYLNYSGGNYLDMTAGFSLNNIPYRKSKDCTSSLNGSRCSPFMLSEFSCFRPFRDKIFPCRGVEKYQQREKLQSACKHIEHENEL